MYSHVHGPHVSAVTRVIYIQLLHIYCTPKVLKKVAYGEAHPRTEIVWWMGILALIQTRLQA